jgi:hypothetical protein
MSAQSPLVNCYYTQYAHIVKSTAPFSAMEFDRNLRLTIDLNDFPEFSRVRLWTPGMRQNAGMIRARAQIRSGTRKQAFLNHAKIRTSKCRVPYPKVPGAGPQSEWARISKCRDRTSK